MSANISNEGGIGNVRFLKNCMGGWLVQELRRIWRHEDGEELSWEELNRLTEEAPAFTAFIDPDDPGFYNPANMQTAMADFCAKTGQPVPRDRGTFMRVVYESLAMKYRLVNEQICAASGTRSKVVNIVGGGCNNILLNQFTADAMGMPVLTGPVDATAVGNLMAQAMAMGIIGSMQEAQPLIRQAFPIRQYDPRDTANWNGRFDQFRGLVV
jgi:rhamnulokinase